MKINYVIATYNGKCKRLHKYPLPKDVLKEHIKKVINLSSSISQITIMKATSNNFYTDYYDIENLKSTTNIPIKIIDCENFGYSEGQWLKSYEIYKNEFDYYLFIEDDYCPNMINYEKILINSFKNKFPNNIGLLCSLVEGSNDYATKGGYPTHFEGCVFINKETLKKLYQTPKWNGHPRKYLDLIDNSIAPGYNWKGMKNSYIGAYYQLTFSHLFTLSNIKHEDYLDIKYDKNLLQFPYWEDLNNNIGGEIFFYNKGDNIRKEYTIDNIFNSPIIPIQLYNIAAIKFNTSITSFPTEIFPDRICLDIVDQFKDIVKDKVVCDIGCGAGDILEYLRLRKLCKKVIGIEINKNRYNPSRSYIQFGDVFQHGVPEADVYILWLGIEFQYKNLFASIKKDAIILLLDSAENNHQSFQKLNNIKLIKMIHFDYDENQFINPTNKETYLQLLRSKYQAINPNFKITGKRFFGVYQYKYI